MLEDSHNATNDPCKQISVDPADLELGQLFLGVVLGFFRQGLHLGILRLYIFQVVTSDEACNLFMLLQCLVSLVGVVTNGASLL